MLHSLAASWILIVHCCFIVELGIDVVLCVTPLGWFGVSFAETSTTNKTLVAIVLIVAVLLPLQRRRYIKKNAKYVADTGGEWQKPSLREAMIWQHEYQFRKYGSQFFPLWTTGSAELGQLGVGIGLYFESVRYFGRFALISALLGAVSCSVMEIGYVFSLSPPPARAYGNYCRGNCTSEQLVSSDPIL